MEFTTEVTKNIQIQPGPGKANLLYFVWFWIREFVAIEWKTGKGNEGFRYLYFEFVILEIRIQKRSMIAKEHEWDV